MKVSEVRARWSPEGCESVCKVDFIFSNKMTTPLTRVFALLGLLCCDQRGVHWMLHTAQPTAAVKRASERVGRLTLQLCKEIWKEFQEVHLDSSRGQITNSINHITGKTKIHNKASETNQKKTHDIRNMQYVNTYMNSKRTSLCVQSAP